MIYNILYATDMGGRQPFSDELLKLLVQLQQPTAPTALLHLQLLHLVY